MKVGFIICGCLLFCSCNYKVYNNGKFDHKDYVGNSDFWISSYDSCIVLLPDESLPVSNRFIDDIRILTPSFPPFYDFYSPAASLLERAKEEARRKDANVIQIVTITKALTTTGRQLLDARLYHINQDEFAAYQKTHDTVIIQSGHSIVHIKDYYAPFPQRKKHPIPVFFNKQQIGYCTNSLLDHPDTSTFKLSSDGWLACLTEKYKIRIEAGHEYYLHIVGFGKHYFPYLQTCTRYDF